MMDGHGRSFNAATEQNEDMDLRRGPWTMEEDLILMNYIANNGEGRWNSLARCAGLKRTGKSCRLRWLNYLRPDVRRGNITPEEQLLILELHSRWGNRWSKIAQHLPGRTDNEIKNYWRTRVQKHAKQLQCDVNSKQFRDAMRYIWMPRLVEKIRAAAAASGSTSSNTNTTNTTSPGQLTQPGSSAQVKPNFTPEYSSTAASSDSIETQVSPVSDFADFCFPSSGQAAQVSCLESLTSPYSYFNQGLDFSVNNEQNEWFGGDISENLWDMEDICFMQSGGN